MSYYLWIILLEFVAKRLQFQTLTLAHKGTRCRGHLEFRLW